MPHGDRHRCFLPDLAGFTDPQSPGSDHQFQHRTCLSPARRGERGEAGGESGIRTRGGFPHTRFPVAHLRPLGHLSRTATSGPAHTMIACSHHHCRSYHDWRSRRDWRRGRDSNPRRVNTLSRFRIYRLRPLGHLSKNSPLHAGVNPHLRRRARKNPRRRSAASSAQTPSSTSKRWFSRGWSARSPSERRKPPLGSRQPKTQPLTRASTSAPAHIAQGSSVAYTTQSVRRQVPRCRAARWRASSSAWAVGSCSASRRL